jgi:hypothetical protein
MADRYWVGGAGTWDATTTTNWSATSGGAGGASAPTSADNVIFNTLSNATAYAVTVGTNANALDITIAGPAVGNVTITSGATAVINCYGSWTNAATGVVFTTTTGAAINFLATTTGKTITTNNVTLGAMVVTLNGVGGEWSLGSAFTCTNAFIVTAGVFSTSASNYAFTPAAISSSNSNVRSISLNASTVTLSGTSPIVFTTATNLTFTAGTSAITCSNASLTFNGGAQTFYDVTFSSAAAGTTSIAGANTFNNLTQTSRSATGVRSVIFGTNQTINGTLTLGAANTSIRRILVYSTTAVAVGVGTPITLTVATIATLADVNFRDIVAAGASGTWSGTRLSNGGGNSNITFAAGVNKYWNLAAGGNWSATAWALTSGGAVDTNNLPLAQDTVIIENTGLTAGNTITIDNNWWLPTINASTRTTAFTLASGTQTPIIFGDFNIPSVTTVTGTGIWYFGAINATQNITTNGVSLTFPITIIGSTTNTVKLLGNLTLTNTVTLTQGTLDVNGYTLTVNVFNASSTGVRTLAFGTGKIVVTGNNTTVCSTNTGTGLTVTGSKRIELSYSGGVGTRQISGATTATAIEGTNLLDYFVTAGTDIITFNGARSYGTIDFSNSGTSTFTTPGSFTNGALDIFGNLTLNSTMVIGGGTSNLEFKSTTGTKTITIAGQTLDCGIVFNGVGGTWEMQDALTLSSTRTLLMTNGTLKLKSGTTSTVGAFATSGTNPKYLYATTFGSQATISDASGTNTVEYLTIQDSNATGGAIFDALAITNVDAGNNTGWLFSTTPSIGNEITMRLRSFTQPRRF